MTSMQKIVAYSAIVVGILAVLSAVGSSLHIAYHLLGPSGFTKSIFLIICEF